MVKKLLMGNEAFAYAALEAGVRVVAGYPGTPSSELIETVAKLREQGVASGVHVEWSTNEKAALEVVAGASYCGARTLFTCKQVGLNVASDALMSLNYVGVRGGTVLFVADDPGPISSQTEQDTRRFASFAKVPVLDPATPEQGFAMMKQAFELSERFGTPVIVRPTTRICHASTFFEVADRTDAMPLPEEGFRKDPRWVIFPRRSYEAHGEINDRLRDMARAFSGEEPWTALNPVFDASTASGSAPAMPPAASRAADAGSPGCLRSEDAASAPASVRRVGIVAGGVSVAYAREALEEIARRARQEGCAPPACRLMQIGTPYPFPAEAAARFVEGLDEVLVLEELDHVIEDELWKLAGQRRLPLSVRGKLTGDALDRGENSVEDAVSRIARFLGVPALSSGQPSADRPLAAAGSLPARPPVLCAGCPHRGSFYAVKRALGGAGAVLCGDIGCYTLGNAAPLDAVDTCLCMGAGITMAQGFSIVEPQKKHLAFVGDSTFFASGLTGIANAVYNGHDITVCVLDNATTAMTGSQPHPGTGVTLMGRRREPIVIEAALEALGVACIEFADPLDLDASIEAVRRALAFAGPSAVIFRSPCVQLVKPAPVVEVRADACTGCKKCITEIGCPGLGFSFDAKGPRSKDRGQAFVDASLCNGCELCVQVCPFDAIGAADAAGDGAAGGRATSDEPKEGAR